MTINVTAEHIAKGKIGRCRYCPIALALRDAGFVRPEVGASAVNWGVNGAQWAHLPIEVCRFIRAFDVLGHGVPFSFELEV